MLPVDKGIPFVTKEKNSTGYISRFSYPLRRMLHDISFRICRHIILFMIASRINPTGSDRIHAGNSRKTDRKCMSQSRYSTFGCRITFRIGLRLESTGRRNIHNSTCTTEIVLKRKSQKIRSRYSHTLHIQEVFIRTIAQYSSICQASIIYQTVNLIFYG